MSGSTTNLQTDSELGTVSAAKGPIVDNDNCRYQALPVTSPLLHLFITAQPLDPGLQLIVNATQIIDAIIETYQLGTLLALETVAVNRCSITGGVSFSPIGAFSRARWQSCVTTCITCQTI